jgi:NADPH-dependent 2,4-dienoyl-CoA reductase/sulfur reductase-like enzyme
VGGGPAGLEAARTLAERGHNAVLFEKDSQLGGTLRAAGLAPFKSDLKKYLDWSIRMTTRNKNIRLRLSTEATPELIAKEEPDALILAIGNKPIIPSTTCQDESRVIPAHEIENRKTQAGDNILIVGAGLTGCEIALQYLQHGKKVTLIDALPREEIGSGSSPINAYAIFNMLEELNVDLRCRTKLIDVTEDYSVVVRNGKEEELISDTVILSLGTRVNTEAIVHLRTAVKECYVVGDGNGRQGLWNATTSAFDAAMVI